MIALVAADLLKLRRRRGLWFTTLLLPSALVLLIVLLTITDTVDGDGGGQFVEDFSYATTLIATILASLVGARLGSEERAAGTLRYQLLTGTSRGRLYLAKVGALVAVCVALTGAATLTMTIGSVVVPLNGADATTVGDVLAAFWAVFLQSFAYGALAFGVGALMGSTGPAIAVALVLSLVGVNLLSALTLIDDWFRHLVLSLGIDRLTFDDAEPEDRVSVVAAILMVAAWSGGALLAGWLRIRRIEV
ncbi:ABC transporter permease subunit [Conexibacter sp. W3-3-2]|uniref:ABC transporter permease n=1 Tax=Paraconexibacter algicola TaxID=2133960 RepID=A0A2T4UBU8_9ACTN|nr:MULTISPECIES: ABC transporter permease [Solirubrobacterales]MTD44265.1 ABC transporter permease subunit [Conexibacter sp. W3-3-2]PTL54368.1 hypothetical protein C7Y72_21785 [Paraconexibacter algicola]